MGGEWVWVWEDALAHVWAWVFLSVFIPHPFLDVDVGGPDFPPSLLLDVGRFVEKCSATLIPFLGKVLFFKLLK